MSLAAAKPTPTPLPVHLSETECTALIFAHLSRPKRGPKGTRGYSRVLNLSLWVLSTGMPWPCVPVPQDRQGKPAIPDTTVDKVFATWADDGSLGQACIARVTPRSAEKPLDISVRQGDGTNTVAPKGGLGVGSRGTHTRRAKKSSRSRPTMALSELPSPGLPCMQRLWCSCPRACKP